MQPYLISEFKTGINTYLQPWIRPQDAFEPLVNAYVYRGTINKRSGYSQFGNTLADGNPVMGLIRYIDQATGVISLLAATTAHLYLYNPGPNTFTLVPVPSGFSGNITNFFNYANWQAVAGGASIVYMTNDVDPVTLYNGSVATQPVLTTSSITGQTLTTCLGIRVYKNRLLYIRPTLSTSAIPENQTIWWSAQSNPTNLDADVAGNGGFKVAPTGDIIMAAEFIRDILVVFFTNSTWIFRYTGNDSDPFRWDKVNNSKSTNSPYGAIPYDERSTSIGSTGFIACDGVNVQRYDIPIIDYYETNFSEQYYNQAFSQRYDNLNQGWTLYVSQQNTFPLVGGVAPGSDQAIIYNFLENSWSTYTWSIPLTCLGLFQSQMGLTWASATTTWQDTPQAWNSFSTQKSAPILLAGDTTGHVWYMDNEDTIVDGQINVVAEVIAVGTGVATYTGTVAQPPVIIGTFTATDGIETFTDIGGGRLLGNMGGFGNIVYSTGVFTLTFIANVGIGVDITANYITGTSIVPDIVTTRWNPIMQLAQKVQFGWIDIYYYISTSDSNNPISVTLNFYVDNSENIALSRPLTLDGPANSEYAFKRIYVNLIGEFIQMEIDPTADAYIQFVGFILWAKPSGRLTP